MSSNLTNPNSRRKKKTSNKSTTHSKDFENSQLAAMIGNLASDREEHESNSRSVAKEIPEISKETIEIFENEPKIEDKSDIPDFSSLPKKSYNEEYKQNKGLVDEETSSPFKKVASRQKSARRSKNGLLLNEDDTYKLGKSTLYNRILTVSKSLSVREDVLDILEVITRNEQGKVIKGYKSDIVTNAIMKELVILGVLNEEEVKRELKPYR